MIPLSIPNISGNEWKYVKDCLDTGWISSVGQYVNDFEKYTAEFTGSKYAVACVNGSAALHLSLQLAGIHREDYVIAPNITFVATCNTISYHGAHPILIDVDEFTWQMDLDILEEFLQNKTTIGERDGKPCCIHSSDNKVISIIMPVHVLGNMCYMDRMMGLATKYHLTVVEDSTEALGSTYKGKHAGTFGIFGTSSFNGNKIISTGGGGMIFTQDEALAKKAKHFTTQAKTDPFEYHHDETAYNYRLVNMLAAIGVAQLELLPGFLARKKEIDETYRKNLENDRLRFQKVTDGVSPNNWLHTMWVTDQRAMIKHLLEHEIQCRPFWVPMNMLPMYTNNMYLTHNNISEKVYRHCISIPSSTNLTNDQIIEVIQVIKAGPGY